VDALNALSTPEAPAGQAAVAEIATVEQLAALVHPVRRQLLAALVEPASPSEVARRLGIAAQIANYHVRALEAAGLVREVETRQIRNLLEHRFRAVARSFTLSTALPLTDAQRRRLQGDVALQQLVRAGDAIRQDALRLLETRVPGEDGGHNAVALELDVDLPNEADREAFVRALSEAIRTAAAPFRATRKHSGEHHRYRTHVAIYPAAPETPVPAPSAPSSAPDQEPSSRANTGRSGR
jgi:DNA-binding transcriptional ArsR family regulator